MPQVPDLALSVAATVLFVVAMLFMVTLAMREHPNARHPRRR